MVYTNLKAKENGLHVIWESSLLLSVDVGNVYDALVRDESNNPISVDNGVALKIGDYSGNGLEERYATIAKITDKIAVRRHLQLSRDRLITTQTQQASQSRHIRLLIHLYIQISLVLLLISSQMIVQKKLRLEIL